MPVDELTIAKRFNGPPRSGNGGYVGGLLGQLLGGCATVRLHSPPPLDRPLQLRREEPGYVLLDGERRVAAARPGAISLTPPSPPDADQAREASRAFVDGGQDIFRGCFVCGSARAEGDGLRARAWTAGGRGVTVQ